MDRTRLLLADRHPIVRAGIRCLLAERSDVALVGEAENREETLRLVEETTIDLLLLGMNLPAMESLTLAQQLYDAGSPVHILVLSAHDEEQYVFEMLACGVAGYVTKEEPSAMIIQAIDDVINGRTGWLSARIAAQLTKRRTVEFSLSLSRRERDVVHLIAQGSTNLHIAETLHISADTVKNHITNIYSKLGVRTRAEAVAWAWRHGLAP